MLALTRAKINWHECITCMIITYIKAIPNIFIEGTSRSFHDWLQRLFIITSYMYMFIISNFKDTITKCFRWVKYATGRTPCQSNLVKMNMKRIDSYPIHTMCGQRKECHTYWITFYVFYSRLGQYKFSYRITIGIMKPPKVATFSMCFISDC